MQIGMQITVKIPVNPKIGSTENYINAKSSFAFATAVDFAFIFAISLSVTAVINRLSKAFSPFEHKNTPKRVDCFGVWGLLY